MAVPALHHTPLRRIWERSFPVGSSGGEPAGHASFLKISPMKATKHQRQFWGGSVLRNRAIRPAP